MTDYQPFAISNFRTGFDEAVEPWLLPRDAYQSMINCHLYRGVLEKIDGYTFFAPFTYRNILSLGTPDGSTKTFTVTLSPLPVSTNIFAYGTITAGSSAETFQYASDASSTVINLVGSNGGSGTVDITTGVATIEFNVAPPAGTYSSIFIIWDSDVPEMSETAIMGIKQFYEDNGSQQVLVFDQKRVGIIESNMGILAAQEDALNVVSEVPHDYYQSAAFTVDGSTGPFTGTLAGAPFVPGTLIFTEYTAAGDPVTAVVNGQNVNVEIVDNGQGGLLGTGVAVTGEVNYVTGNYTITFGAATTNTNYFDATTGIYGDLFTGSISNFFSLTNYQFNAFFCNNVDPIFYYDGTSVRYLNTLLEVKPIASTGGKPSNFDITKCLHVFTNRDRLLLLSPTVDGNPEPNSVYWSRVFNPLDFTNDENLPAPTSESIRTYGFINSDLVVRFSNSERVFRYTGDANSPFRWDSTNNIWACDAPYSAINYDSWFSSVGRPAIVGSDAVNVKRVDEIIPDFTDPTRLAQETPVPWMNQTSIAQCYGERFDDIKEGWLCYNSQPVSEDSVTPSDNILAFNYLDSTYAIYQFPFSCLGFGRIINVPTWGTTFTNWEDMDLTWDSYQLTSNALIDLAGDQFDAVYELNSGNTLGDGTSPVLMSAITKNFNPFIEEGQLVRLGYVDLLVSANITSILRVQFFLNDQLYIDASNSPAGFYQETTLTFNPKDAMSPISNQVKVWKRVYVGAVGKEHTIRFYQNTNDFTDTTLDQPIYIHAMVLYMKPAGRIFN